DAVLRAPERTRGPRRLGDPRGVATPAVGGRPVSDDDEIVIDLFDSAAAPPPPPPAPRPEVKAEEKNDPPAEVQPVAKPPRESDPDFIRWQEATRETLKNLPPAPPDLIIQSPDGAPLKIRSF